MMDNSPMYSLEYLTSRLPQTVEDQEFATERINECLIALTTQRSQHWESTCHSL